MSDQHSSSPAFHNAIGVIKFTQEKLGYPGILQIAEEWKKVPGFKQIIIRKASRDDYGIQFIYQSDEKIEQANFSKWFMITFIEKHRDSIYAWDIAYNSSSELKDSWKGLIKNEPLN